MAINAAAAPPVANSQFFRSTHRYSPRTHLPPFCYRLLRSACPCAAFHLPLILDPPALRSATWENDRIPYAVPCLRRETRYRLQHVPWGSESATHNLLERLRVTLSVNGLLAREGFETCRYATRRIPGAGVNTSGWVQWNTSELSLTLDGSPSLTFSSERLFYTVPLYIIPSATGVEGLDDPLAALPFSSVRTYGQIYSPYLRTTSNTATSDLSTPTRFGGSSSAGDDLSIATAAVCGNPAADKQLQILCSGSLRQLQRHFWHFAAAVLRQSAAVLRLSAAVQVVTQRQCDMAAAMFDGTPASVKQHYSHPCGTPTLLSDVLTIVNSLKLLNSYPEPPQFNNTSEVRAMP
ncbi:hypothetical protein B0H11DRAFT_1943128 [Mycena galericulata]|nr:hypothetical protein B0H11DRAFT_1943128 [Mycena galericulata]